MTSPFKRISVLALCAVLLVPHASSFALEPALTAADFAKFPDFFDQPNFRSPSAAHCQRPIQTRETGTRQQIAKAESSGDRADKRGIVESAVPGKPSGTLSYLPVPAPVSAPVPAVVAEVAPPLVPVAKDKAAARSRLADASTASVAGKPSAIAPSGEPVAQQAVVTAGVVDDNADFGEYLAFRQRTQVTQRARDISERYLLQVHDARDKPVHDAQVRISSPQGRSMWARTDTAGQVWVHPLAFMPAQEAHNVSVLGVRVQKLGYSAQTQLVRGQKSALQVKLDSASSSAKARLDLVFLIDATGSMGDEIDKLKASLRTIVSDIAKLPSQPDLCLGMVAYRDKGDEFLLRSHDFTNDVNSFQSVLNALKADGGGDTPEAMNEALNDAVHNLSWRGDGATRVMILVADAPPHLDYGGPQYDKDMMAALGKGIKIFSVGTSGLDKQGEFIQRQMAQYTGGRFVFLTYAQAHNSASGAGKETAHDVQNYSVDTLDRLIVRLVKDELSKL